MPQENQNSFLGTGWSFPPQFMENACAVEMVDHEEDIKQSLSILLSTTPGERIMHPAFGCNIKKMVFEKINEGQVTKIKDSIEKAILFFEPRINLESIDIDIEDDPSSQNSIYEGVMHIDIIYIIRQTNTRSNMVYPFYFSEADNI